MDMVVPSSDDDWVKGKSGLKALQYMALGLPVVASNVGCNYRVVEHDKTGFLATTTYQWYNYLSLLIEDANLRRRLGTAGRRKVISEYSVEANKSNYLNIFNQVYDPSYVTRKY